MDYISTPLLATFSASTTTANINVPISEDDIIETEEVFNLTFTIPLSINDMIITGTERIATGVIIDSTSKYS